MIDKIGNSQIPDFMENASRQTDSAKNSSANDADASLQVDYAFLLEEAAQRPASDSNLVQQAQQLLQSGQLESPENIRAAAANIVKFGI